MDKTPLQPASPDRIPHCGDEGRTPTTPHMNGAPSGGLTLSGSGLIGGGGTAANRLPSRRPQAQISPLIEQAMPMSPQLLALTIHKDSNGYGMKVSGDNPVYVESVKPGGAAQKAGLIAGDMILRVNGVEVRSEKHTTVVALIKSHVVVELTVRRSHKMQRPNSVGLSPSTPILQRDRTASITGPQPVDNAKRREMEFSKIKTLQLMLEQEKKNLDNLKLVGNGVNNRQDRARAETTIRKLQEQLRQVGGEDSSVHFLITSPTLISPSSHNLATTPQTQNSSPAFLSRFPRSLSSLSLGTRKKNDKEVTSPLSSNTIIQQADLVSATSPSQLLQQQQQHIHQKSPHTNQPVLSSATPAKKRFTGSERNLREDIPPPLPQRNPPRNCGENLSGPVEWRRNIPVSDLDHSMSISTPSPKTSSTPCSSGGNNAGNKGSSNKKRPKTKTKALSDPKMSTQMFLQMEKECGDGTDCSIPPPLPPRQPGMMEENQNILNSNKAANSGNMNTSGGCSRPLPNSVDTLMNYPLVATCTTVRDNMSAAFPLSQRPNIVQQLQQHQQHLHQLHHNPSMHSSSTVNKSTILGQTPQHMNHLNKHRRVVSSPEHMQPRHDRHIDRHNKSSSGSWELIEKDNEATPPGTPPPPYLSSHLNQSQTGHPEDADVFIEHTTASMGSPTHQTFPNQILAAQANTLQKEIISMEDEEISDQECTVDEHGPFNYLQRLLEPENVAHLAVFLNYVLSNSDPSPLLFYLITGLYKEGTVKDMRKWAYEIHSTFLVPCAPLLWFNVDESLAREVDNVLQNEYDKVEILRKVFWKSRKKAKEKICDQLRDFQQKRTAGLGTMYGPSDQQLADAKGDKAKEQKIFEDHLIPKLQHLVEELDKEAPYECPKKLALCSALCTVLHRIFVTRSAPGSPIDRVHHFVSREKSFKSRIMGKNRKIVVRGHPLVLRQYYEVTHCNHCQTIIWGVSPQGYHCTDCKLNIHRHCSKVLDDSCPGPVPQKRKEPYTDNKISKFMGKIRPTHHFIQNERNRRMEEETGVDNFLDVSGSGQATLDTDKFRVSSFKRRIRGRKSPVKSSSLESDNISSPTTNATAQESENDGYNPRRTNVLRASTDPPTRKLGRTLSNEIGKEKVLLTDRKFKNNRIEKSSSKTKVNDLEKRESLKGRGRKISAPPVLDGAKNNATKKNSRAHSNLNLNALVKLVSSNKKLSTEDFDKIRRKSLSEAASSVVAIATGKGGGSGTGKCESGIADDAANDNVVLTKHDFKDSFTDNVNNNKSINDVHDGNDCDDSYRNKDNFRDEDHENNVEEVLNKKSSPSLTSRVAAKITETTNNYKNRKKSPKKRKAPRRPEFYKQLSTDRPNSASVVRQPSDRRPDLSSTPVSSGSSGNASHNTSELTTSQSLDNDTNSVEADHDSKRDRSKSKSAPVSVNRSESYKERLSHKRNRTNRRKTSDPSLSKTNDEQSELGLSNDNYTASSSSSLSSSSLESPSTSLEQVSGSGTHAGVGGAMTTASGTVPTPRQWVDSDDETDLTEVDWSSNVHADLLSSLSDAEKKRQEIINEIYQTERNHVRTLRLLEGIFMLPLLESNVLPYDHLQLLFPPALINLKDLHSSFEQQLKYRRTEHSYIVKNVGDLLVGMFEGISGDELREYAAQFCARQQIALEALKEKRRKDENLQRLLTKAESHKACRRLQLKDLLPTVLQRLTKYPLLFENLYKITKRVIPDDEHEADAIQRALDSSKRILVDVNQAVKLAEDAHKLQTIQRKLDKSSFDKDASNEFKSLDLTQYKLVYDGQLTMKKNPGVQLHGLLFENMMVLLQKQDDKYFLKNFPHNNAAGTNENNKLISPITHFDQQTLVRQSAVDKNAFFLIITKTSQMLELRAPSSSECKTWFKHISDAAEQYKPRSKSSHEVVEDPATTTLPHSNTKESFESAPERASSIPSNNNSFNAEPPGYHHDQNHTNINATSYEKGNKNILANSNASTDNQKDKKYESNNNASSNDSHDIEDDKIGIKRAESRRDSVYSNNSNNTRTLMQHCPLLEPTEIQISISPAHTAEPILTPTERLKRLDDAIRDRLSEKQQIICDMFRVPNEHFAAIADIAAQPEAPKDTSDIVLAAFAQVQSLTEVLSEYMKVTPEQEISAVSTAVCDQCHQRSLRAVSPMPSSIASTNTGTTIIQNPEASEQLDNTIIQEDDGYCEIDELRLPSVMTNTTSASGIKSLPSNNNSGQIATSTAELAKRQSTISADSIPEESEQDITHDEQTNNSKSPEKDESATQSENPSDGQQKTSDDSSSSEHIEVNDAYDSTASSLNKTVAESNYECVDIQNSSLSGNDDICGPYRYSHVSSLGPSIPCHLISNIVTALGAQISLLLPKINERDAERERLRRENQHLRELVHAMHECERVKEEDITPKATKNADKSDKSQETAEYANCTTEMISGPDQQD